MLILPVTIDIIYQVHWEEERGEIEGNIHVSNTFTHPLSHGILRNTLVFSSAYIEEESSVRLSDFAKMVEFASGKAREPCVTPKSMVLQFTLPAFQSYKKKFCLPGAGN